MSSEKILALVLADGQDLLPMDIGRVRSSMSLGGYRLIDFVLSNLVNSGIESIYVLARDAFEALAQHVSSHWAFANNDDQRFIKVVPAAPQHGECCGATDAIFQHVSMIERHAPDLVAIFAADQVCHMDVRQMIDYHRERGAEVTIAAAPVPLTEAPLHDIIVAGYNGEVWDFQEKPDIPSPIPFDPAHAYASTGNYVFDADVLVGCLTEVAQHGEADLGRALLPQLVHTRLAFAYDFSSNGMPGTPPNEELYWRNIEIMQAYFDATRDVEGAAPRFRLHNVRWPILAQQGRSVPETQTAWLSRLDMLQPANTLVYH